MTEPDFESLVETLIYASKNVAYAEDGEDRGQGGGQTVRALWELQKAHNALIEAINKLKENTNESPRQV